MNYTKEDLLKLAELIDNAYRPHTRDNDKADEIISNFIENGFEEAEQEQEEIPITYATIQRRIGWSRFAEETNRNVYAIKEYGDYPPNKVFYITEEQAKKLNL